MCGSSARQVELDFSPYTVSWYAESISTPSNVHIYQVNGSITAYKINSTANYGSITFRVREGGHTGTIIGEYIIYVYDSCSVQSDICCGSNPQTIRWLSTCGGIKEFVFNGLKTFDIRIGSAVTFKNSSLQKLYAQRQDVYTGKLISTGDISKDQADFLDELKYCIQAWEWDGTTATPIIVDNESYTKYKSSDKFYDVNLKYAICEEIQVQTQ